MSTSNNISTSTSVSGNVPFSRPLKYTARGAAFLAFSILPVLGTALGCLTSLDSYYISWLRCGAAFYASCVFTLLLATLYAAQKLGTLAAAEAAIGMNLAGMTAGLNVLLRLDIGLLRYPISILYAGVFEAIFVLAVKHSAHQQVHARIREILPHFVSKVWYKADSEVQPLQVTNDGPANHNNGTSLFSYFRAAASQSIKQTPFHPGYMRLPTEETDNLSADTLV